MEALKNSLKLKSQAARSVPKKVAKQRKRA